MSLKTIYLTRHGFRSNWVVDPKTGTYTSSLPTPTGIPSDPALAAKGVSQALELASHLSTLTPRIERVYSSPFYRCIQTIAPTINELNAQDFHHNAVAAVITNSNGTAKATERVQVRLENGIGEWYGTARFDHPSPASVEVLDGLFKDGLIDTEYMPVIVPSKNGESITSLHSRCAYALHRVIAQADAEGVKALCICTHAASLIAIGRVLVGRMPHNIEEEDFRPFTCGVSVFERRGQGTEQVGEWNGGEEPSDIPVVQWKDGQGVGGGWVLKVSGDCSFLSGGEERGWRFSGDESFHSEIDKEAGLDAGSGLGVVIEGRRNSPSRL